MTGPPVSLPLKPGPGAVIKIAKLQVLLLLYPVRVAVALGIFEALERLEHQGDPLLDGRGDGREHVPGGEPVAADGAGMQGETFPCLELDIMQAFGAGAIAGCCHLASGCHLPHSWHL